MQSPEQLTEQTVFSQLRQLASDPEIQQLVGDISNERFGDAVSYELGNIKEFSASMQTAFNFRIAGAERGNATSLEHGEQFTDRIHKLAEKVGLAGDTVPTEPKADAVLVLGGAGKSPLDRTKYTKELLSNKTLDTNTVVLLGSSRPVDDAERSRGGAYAKTAQTEYDLMMCAAAEVFDISFNEQDEIVGYDDKVPTGFEGSWKIAHAVVDGINVFVLQSPMLTEQRFYPDTMTIKDGAHVEKLGNRRARANTSDTYNMFAKVAELQEGSKVVAVTNAHFRPFQGADAVAELSTYGIKTEVVGYDPSHFGNPPKKNEELLQETLSAVNSLNNAWQKASNTVIAIANQQ